VLFMCHQYPYLLNSTTFFIIIWYCMNVTFPFFNKIVPKILHFTLLAIHYWHYYDYYWTFSSHGVYQKSHWISFFPILFFTSVCFHSFTLLNGSLIYFKRDKFHDNTFQMLLLFCTHHQNSQIYRSFDCLQSRSKSIKRKEFCDNFLLMFLLLFFLQMHSRFLVFVWRKKLLLLATSLAFFVAILWGFVYSTHVSHNDDGKGMSIKVDRLGIKQHMMQNSFFFNMSYSFVFLSILLGYYARQQIWIIAEIGR
jgi:hypothetical protein